MEKDELALFRSTYIAECNELLQDMEELLLNLDHNNTDSETLNAIFRCAHSIKGGAGIFSLIRIGEFTHVLEALLDNVRSGILIPEQSIIDVLLEAADALKKMVAAADNNQEVAPDFAKAIEGKLEALIKKESVPINQNNPIVPIPKDRYNKFYHIKFYPHKEIFQSGNEPLLIFRELKKHGNATITPDISALPGFMQLNPEESYLNFEIDIETKDSIEEIKEIFEFVESDCSLEIKEVAGIFEIPLESASTQIINVDEEKVIIKEEKTKTKAIHKTKEHPEEKESAGKSIAQTTSSIRVDVSKIDRLVNLVGELVITQAMITAQTQNVASDQHSALVRGVEALSHHARDLQEAVMSVRMQPVKSLFSRMPRLVRDLSHRLKKDIEVELIGETTEVDKSIIEQLNDPLTHMIRNSVDHGIELPAERITQGKKPQGTIKLSADQRGGKIVIEITDDGAGIDRAKVLKKAITLNLISENDAANLNPEQIDYMIFAAGFSTADSISDISGRGVGMDVAKRNIEKIGGAINLKNNPGKGLTCLIYIPLTLAILDGMIIGVGQESYVIPISNIIETLRLKNEDIRKIGEGNEVINVRGEFIRILHLYKLFHVEGAQEEPAKALVVIIESSNGKYGLVIDELIGQQQVVIKSLSDNSTSIEGFSGATILGDGKVALILDMGKLQAIEDAQTKTKSVV